MKTKELIQRLQEADPSGEIECCLGNADIHFVDVEPAYYDGCLQVLIHDPAKAPYYDIVGAKYVSRGSKVVIHSLSINDAIFDDEDLPVEFDVSDSWQERYKTFVQERREETKRISEDVEKGTFIQYARKRFADQYGEDFSEEEVTKAAIEFYDENLNYKDPLPKDLVKMKVSMKLGGKDSGKEQMVWASWNDRRKAQWDREITLDFDGAKMILKANK